MGRLSSDEILNDHKTRDADSIITLSLTHKAISDLSCLTDFKNLERLDLSFNSLTSLENLRGCVNIKWLSVVQNKLQNLKGIEGLTKLTVLNAGKNKITSLDEVKKLVNLCALIMNDNEIVSICKLEELKYLNTIVLSRNPLRKLSLDKLKLMSKLSLSNCQLEAIDVSIKVCTELKELRLAHNDIKTLPAELAHNIKLQNLDLGNNLISRLSDLKVLSSLQHLKNLNLHGNPIVENDKLVKKIRKLVPSIQIFNSKPIEKYMKNEQDEIVLVSKKSDKERDQDEKNKHRSMEKVKVREAGGAYLDVKEKSRHTDMRKKEKRKKLNEYEEKEACAAGSENKLQKAAEKTGFKVIDDRDTPFWELVVSDTTVVVDHGKRVRDLDSLGSLVVEQQVKKKKKKETMSNSVGSAVLQALVQNSEVGSGGASAWDDE